MNKEKKTYKSRVLVIGFVAIAIILFVANDTVCHTETQWHCFFGRYSQSILEPLAFFLIGSCIVSMITFFISDKIFSKWLRFTFWYFLMSLIWIAIAPESSGEFITILKTKEEISMFLAPLFVIISIIMFIWMTIKEKKNK